MIGSITGSWNTTLLENAIAASGTTVLVCFSNPKIIDGMYVINKVSVNALITQDANLCFFCDAVLKFEML